MAMYQIVGMYYLAVSRPYLAALFITLGYSLKAGVLLILPAFLGSI